MNTTYEARKKDDTVDECNMCEEERGTNDGRHHEEAHQEDEGGELTGWSDECTRARTHDVGTHARSVMMMFR